MYRCITTSSAFRGIAASSVPNDSRPAKEALPPMTFYFASVDQRVAPRLNARAFSPLDANWWVPREIIIASDTSVSHYIFITLLYFLPATFSLLVFRRFTVSGVKPLTLHRAKLPLIPSSSRKIFRISHRGTIISLICQTYEWISRAFGRPSFSLTHFSYHH